MRQKNENFASILGEMDAGVFESKISAALSETAIAVVNNDDIKKTGKITIEITLERIGNAA